MAKNYTQEEIQSALGKLLRTQLVRPYGPLGNRSENVVFGEVQDAAAGVFVVYGKAPFYVVALGRDVVLENLTATENVLGSLLDAVRATDRFVSPVESISSLANARSALGSLSSSLELRTTSLSAIDSVPAFKRFEKSTDRFLADHGNNVRAAGEIVQTPQEARGALAGYLLQLMELYEDILTRVGYLSDAIGDYDSLNLPATLSSYIISNSRDTLAQRYEELEGMTPEERLEPLRSVVLDVLSTRAAVRGFGALNPSSAFLYFSGQVAPYADEMYPAEPAFIVGEAGPYTIVDSGAFSLQVDGGPVLNLQLPASYVGSLDGYTLEPFVVTTAGNDSLRISTTGAPVLDVTLPAGTLSATSVVNAINTAITTQPLVAEAYASQPYLQGEPGNMVVAGPNVTFTRLMGDWSIPSFTIQVNDWIQVSDAGSFNLGWYKVTDTSGLPASFVAQKETGSPVTETDVVLSFNRGGRAVRVTYKPADKYNAVENGTTIQLIVEGDAVRSSTAALLGMAMDTPFTSLRTPVSTCVEYLNRSPAMAVGGVARVSASEEFRTTRLLNAARTEPTNSLRVVAADEKATVQVMPTFGLTAVITGFSTEHPVGRVVVLREATTNTINNWGVVQSAVGTVLTVIFQTTPFSETGVVAEAGPDLRNVYKGMFFNVPAGNFNVNEGRYWVESLGAVPFDLNLASQIVFPSALGGLPYNLSTDVPVELGYSHLRLASQSTFLDSQLRLSGGPTDVWVGQPIIEYAHTAYMGMDSAPKGVEVGDYLEFRDTAAQEPTAAFTVVAVDLETKVLQLNSTVEATWGVYNMEQGGTLPLARVRKAHKDNYEILRTAIKEWLALPLSDLTRFYRDITRLINPLVVNQNPTVVQVQTAVNKLEQLDAHFEYLRTILEAYEATVVEPVDTLIETYQQQGSQRAVDILVSGQFSVFFGLAKEEVSYLGALTNAIREVNVQDLPQNKFNRNPGGILTDSYAEPDFEFEFGDNDSEEIHPPGEAYDYGGESAF